LEAFGSIWKLTVFAILDRYFVSSTLYSLCLTGEIVTQSASSHKSAKTEKLPNASKMVLVLKRFWKHLETCLEPLLSLNICIYSVKTV
jgi:hypothetical protein